MPNTTKKYVSLAKLTKYDELLKAVEGCFITNMPYEDMSALVKMQLKEVKDGYALLNDAKSTIYVGTHNFPELGQQVEVSKLSGLMLDAIRLCSESVAHKIDIWTSLNAGGFKTSTSSVNTDIDIDEAWLRHKLGDRFEKIKEKLPEPMEPETFAMEAEEVPEYFTRMQSVIKSLAKDNPEFKPVLMDTKFASIAGVCYDKEVLKLNSFVVMDIGNGHTTVASIEEGKIQGVFEHHTRDLTPQRLEELVLALADGTIKHEDVHGEGGHGAFALNPISKLEKVIVAGPKRALIEGTDLDYYHAAPGGDVMMTGTVGLVKSMEFLRKK